MRLPIALLKSEFDHNNKTLNLSTPWLNLELELDDQHKILFESSLSEFLTELKEFPISVICPRTKINKEIMADSSTVDHPLMNLIPKFSWSATSTLEHAKIPHTLEYDPLAAYSKIREMILLNGTTIAKTQKQSDKLKQIRNKNEPQFFNFLHSFLMQSYYVTAACNECLLPATIGNSHFNEIIREFNISESGHERLIEKSIKALGHPICLDLILPETKSAMCILKYAAQTNHFAFACLLPLFEGSHYDDMDPIAELLLGSSMPDAHKGIQEHYMINKLAQHASVGEAAADTIGPISADSIESALRMVESIQVLHQRASDKLFKNLE